MDKNPLFFLKEMIGEVFTIRKIRPGDNIANI